MSLEKGSPRTLSIYGRLKPSADNKILKLEARGENDESVPFELEEQNSKLTSDDWSLLTFTANVVRTNTSEPYNLTLTVDSDWKINGYKTLKLPTTNLYLDFSGTANVMWALTCQPGREASVPENDCSVYRQLCIVPLFALAILATALFVTAYLLYKHWDHREAVTSPSPGTAVPETHDYDYVDLTAVSQLAEGGRFRARNGLERQPTTRSPVATINSSAFDHDGEFQVKAGDATRQKLLTSEDIRLVVETDILLITLLSAEGRRIARWSVEHIRRFSYSDKEFRFEAGRKSVHGTGLFNFITTQGGQIHNLLQKHVQLLSDRGATTGREAHCHPTSGQTPADDNDGYEIPIPPTLAGNNDGYEIPLTFSGNDDGYEIPMTPEEHIYEVIPDIP
ncbi:uncharacterized protein LOC135213704 isoform X2 [Macrobrachium nipponense]|uniref:uncharacterized protein LOC135213704 isoform X2 n=1 Tax=Macrobrachium nipponense TaxID=159736 RepID=UPI0030C88038